MVSVENVVRSNPRGDGDRISPLLGMMLVAGKTLVVVEDMN